MGQRAPRLRNEVVQSQLEEGWGAQARRDPAEEVRTPGGAGTREAAACLPAASRLPGLPGEGGSGAQEGQTRSSKSHLGL